MPIIHVTERRRMSGISSKSVIGQMLCEFYCSPGYLTGFASKLKPRACPRDPVSIAIHRGTPGDMQD